MADRINVRADAETQERWKVAAAQMGMSLSEFVRWAVESKASSPSLSAQGVEVRVHQPAVDFAQGKVFRGPDPKSK